MKTMPSTPLIAMLATLLLAACGSGETEPPVGTPGSRTEPLPPTNPVPPADPTGPAIPPAQLVTPTAVGVVQGAAASASIGPSGGALTSADGHLTLTVPAGAPVLRAPSRLTATTRITMTPKRRNGALERNALRHAARARQRTLRMVHERAVPTPGTVADLR